MKIIISPRAEKELKKLSKINQIAVARKIRCLKDAPCQEEKLKGYQNIFRVRVGEIRIIYRKISQEIYIILIAHRKEVYEILKRLF